MYIQVIRCWDVFDPLWDTWERRISKWNENYYARWSVLGGGTGREGNLALFRSPTNFIHGSFRFMWRFQLQLALIRRPNYVEIRQGRDELWSFLNRHLYLGRNRIRCRWFSRVLGFLTSSFEIIVKISSSEIALEIAFFEVKG